jgi:restriction system protein
MIENFEHLHSIIYYTEVTRSYDTRHVAEIKHTGLSTFRVIKGLDKSIVQLLVDAQFSKWDEQWKKILERNNIQANQFVAEEASKDAKDKLLFLENLLNTTIENDNSFDIDSLYEDKTFNIENPKKNLQRELNQLVSPDKPQLHDLPVKPNKLQFEEKSSFLDKLIKSRKEKKIEFEEFLYNNAIIQWENECKNIEERNKNLIEKYDEQVNVFDASKEKLISKYDILENGWVSDKKDFYIKQDLFNEGITDYNKSYLNKEPTSIVRYCDYVLTNSNYIETFPKSFEIEFKADEKILVVEYVLPCIEDLPKIAEVKFIAVRKELREVILSETQQLKNYESTIYKIVLRTIYELFQADGVDAIELIAFNGWVNAINKGTGKRVNNCIVSIQVGKDEFNGIDLSNVDPKTCFKNLKGVSGSKLSSVTAIKPIIQINRNDKRFVSSYDVTDSIDESSNLAIMSWEDFEHLIREIFEKEFSYNGGEVKVTQASRDGGVDAIAFDPDPIRGGKIIIQAKRYTNTVGVSAVRDLYGTVMNEGATKGILVTTTDYGPDAYEFVKNKPLTLMNGANLLYLLEKHGHKAKIDIAEARFLMAKNNQV